MTLIMNDKRSNLTTSSLNSLLTVRLSNTDYKDYDPLGAISKWSPWDLPDNKKRRTESKPYGPRPLKAAKTSEEHSQSQAQATCSVDLMEESTL